MERSLEPAWRAVPPSSLVVAGCVGVATGVAGCDGGEGRAEGVAGCDVGEGRAEGVAGCDVGEGPAEGVAETGAPRCSSCRGGASRTGAVGVAISVEAVPSLGAPTAGASEAPHPSKADAHTTASPIASSGLFSRKHFIAFKGGFRP